MAGADGRDPVRATMIAILQQLNRAESLHEGREHDQALELAELQRLLDRFWATDREPARIPQALGLLVRNGLVGARAPAVGARAHARTARYRITASGKQFLVEALAKTDRIS
jgi:hypothetical protein